MAHARMQYQQIFAVSQALPGSPSAKMLFCIHAVHGGLFAGALAFAFSGGISTINNILCFELTKTISSLPGAIGMYGLSVGISPVGETLPDPVYALLSGLTAATVGIIALTAVNLAGRAVTDKLTRLLVFLGGALGMLYTALWYYPVIMIGAGLSTLIWDLRWLQTGLYHIAKFWRRPKEPRKSHRTKVERTEWPKASAPPNTLRSSPHYSLEKPLPSIRHSLERSNLTEIGTAISVHFRWPYL